MTAPRAHLGYTAMKDLVDRLVVTDKQVKAGFLTAITFDIADAASADYDVKVADKFEVIDVLVQKRGGAGGVGGTVTVKNGSDAISDAIDINDADKTLSRATTIDDAFSTIAAGGTLRVAVADAADSSVFVTVIGVVRA